MISRVVVFGMVLLFDGMFYEHNCNTGCWVRSKSKNKLANPGLVNLQSIALKGVRNKITPNNTKYEF